MISSSMSFVTEGSIPASLVPSIVQVVNFSGRACSAEQSHLELSRFR